MHPSRPPRRLPSSLKRQGKLDIIARTKTRLAGTIFRRGHSDRATMAKRAFSLAPDDALAEVRYNITPVVFIMMRPGPQARSSRARPGHKKVRGRGCAHAKITTLARCGINLTRCEAVDQLSWSTTQFKSRTDILTLLLTVRPRFACSYAPGCSARRPTHAHSSSHKPPIHDPRPPFAREQPLYVRRRPNPHTANHYSHQPTSAKPDETH